ncbi:anti-sigma factor [Candidatus Daviesbacteria bacterium]|nr:anti-sigma factor [Candidatus Daviesbacteria bacterium]
MKQSYLIIGILVLAVIGILWYTNSNKSTQNTIVNSTPQPTTTSEVVNKEQKAELKAVGNYSGSGTASRNFENGVFTHTVTANLADPAQGKFYEGWLVDKEPTLRFFSTGKLNKEGGVYKLTFTANQDYPEHNDVVITEETESLGLDGKPEAHVLEGNF